MVVVGLPQQLIQRKVEIDAASIGGYARVGESAANQTSSNYVPSRKAAQEGALSLEAPPVVSSTGKGH